MNDGSVEGTSIPPDAQRKEKKDDGDAQETGGEATRGSMPGCSQQNGLVASRQDGRRGCEVKREDR